MKKIVVVKNDDVLLKIKERSFRRTVRALMLDSLPVKKPYQIGIDKIMFEILKDQFAGRHTKLRKTIKSILYRMTESYSYLDSMRSSEFRHGLNDERFTLDPNHKKNAHKKIAALRRRRKRLTRNIKKK